MSNTVLTAEERLQKILESRRANHQKYYRANRQKISDYNRQYYQANKERIAAQKKEAYQAKKGGQDHD